MIDHRASVYSEKHLKVSKKFDTLCEAVQFCNNNGTPGDTCVVTEVLQSLTGEDQLGIITTWVYTPGLDTKGQH